MNHSEPQQPSADNLVTAPAELSAKGLPLAVGHLDEHESGTHEAIRRQVRGSALLLAGRVLAILLNLLTQVIIVRALTKSDYGALAYVLSLVEMLSIVAVVALDKTFLRFGAIYHEQKDHARFLGSLLLVVGVPVIVGLLMVPMVAVLGPMMSKWLALDASSQELFLVATLLVPANGVASVSLSVLTVVLGAKSVFFRRHLFGPLLKLSAVIIAFALGAGPLQFAIAMLIAGAFGFLADIWLIAKIVRGEVVSLRGIWSTARLPLREFIAYSIPVAASDFAFMARGPLLVVLLGWAGTAEETASLRAVMPIAKLNELVLMNFMVLYVPMASRLYATRKFDKLWQVHRQTNLWISTFNFPLFAGCVALARPIAVLLFGPAYADSAQVMIILSAGYFAQSMHGVDGHLLRVLGHMRTLLVVDLLGGALLMGTALLFATQWGANGAASAVVVGIILHGMIRSYCLRRVALKSQPSGSERFAKVVLILGAVTVSVMSLWLKPDWILGTIFATVISIVVFGLLRAHLDVDQTFPELRKLPFAGWLLGPRRNGLA